MSRDDEQKSREDLRDRVETLEQEIERLDNIAISAIDRAKNAEAQAEVLGDRVAELESTVDRVTDALDEDTKQDKVAAMVKHARNKRSDEPIVRIGREELQGVWGCSRRHSYTLVDGEDGLPAEYPWILSSQELKEVQYGNLENDADVQRIGVDFDGVHKMGCPVNRFITEQTKEGESA